jgi:hypothetical protein
MPDKGLNALSGISVIEVFIIAKAKAFKLGIKLIAVNMS